MKGRIFNIQKFCTNEGPGIRTTVFFKGCNLKCKWCHNPESQNSQKEILFYKNKCTGCGRCKDITVEDENFLCFNDAKEICGKEYTVDEILKEVLKDKTFYENSKGGVTFSGGECMLQIDFLTELLKKCKDNGINTAVESAFFVPWDNVEKVLKYVDLFFADLKISDQKKHIEFTGKDNKLIIDNITRLSNKHNNIILRIPVIPGVNDNDEDIDGFAEIIKTLGNGIKEVEMLRYNNLAESKYDIVGKDYIKFADSSQTDIKMQTLCSTLSKKCNLNCYFV